MQSWIGTRAVASVKREQELQLGAVLSKKVGTIDFDFPGVAYFASRETLAGGVSADVGVIAKHTIFFRQKVSPYKYQPLILLKILSVGTAPHSDFTFERSDAYQLGYEAISTRVLADTNNYIQIWDESAAKFSDFVSDIGAFTNKSIITTNTSMANSAVSDFIMVGRGATDVQNWVILDEEINLRSDAKPVAISADIIASFIYDGRINADVIAQWKDMPTNLKKYFREKCGRLFADTL